MMVRILFVLGLPIPRPDAAWTRIGFFARYLKKRGYNVSILGAFSPEVLNLPSIKKWKDLRLFNLNPMFLTKNIPLRALNIFLSLFTLPMLFILLRPRLVIISVPPGELSLGAYFASRFIKAKVLFDIRDEWEDYIVNYMNKRNKRYAKLAMFLKSLMTRIYVKSDFVITVTEPMAKSLRRRGVRRVKLIPNGADIRIFKPYDKTVVRRRLGIAVSDFIMIFSGAVGEYYRLDLIVKALAMLKKDIQKKIKLLIVGRKTPELLKMMAMAKLFGLNDNIIYLGVKHDKEKLAEILSAADLGLVPYDDNILWKNSIPAKFYEYCACKVPILATAREDSVLAKLIVEHKIGLTVPPLAIEKLAEAIYQIYNDRNFRETASKRARALIEKKFDRNKIAEEFLNFLRILI